MIAVPVATGDTLSGIASEHGVSLSSVEAANPGISDPNLIYTGEKIAVPAGGSFTQWTPESSSASPTQTTQPSHPTSSAPVSPTTARAGSPSSPSSPSTQTPSQQTSTGSITDIPGVPQSFVKCVAWRESGNGQYAAYDGGVYGIINASGYHVNGQSLSAQKQAFASIYHSTGPSAWSADGCPGT